MEKENYIKELECRNCGHVGSFGIPKGTTISDYTDAEKCPKCGCRELKVAVNY